MWTQIPNNRRARGWNLCLKARLLRHEKEARGRPKRLLIHWYLSFSSCFTPSKWWAKWKKTKRYNSPSCLPDCANRSLCMRSLKGAKKYHCVSSSGRAQCTRHIKLVYTSKWCLTQIDFAGWTRRQWCSQAGPPRPWGTASLFWWGHASSHRTRAGKLRRHGQYRLKMSKNEIIFFAFFSLVPPVPQTQLCKWLTSQQIRPCWQRWTCLQCNKMVRLGFLRKVYGILTVQLLVTALICAIAMTSVGQTIAGWVTSLRVRCRSHIFPPWLSLQNFVFFSTQIV